MYDTVVIKSPYISEELAKKIELICKRLEGIDLFTGEVLYSFTNGELKGSFDSRIRINVERTEFIHDGKIPVRVNSEPYIRIECSLHKLLLGHNCYGGYSKIKPLILYLIRFIENELTIELPYFLSWRVERIDVAYIFNMNTYKAVMSYIDSHKNMYYSRRKINTYFGGIYFAGATNTIKFYSKGLEFKKHDYKKIKKYINKQLDYNNGKADQVTYLQNLKNLDIIKEKAQPILRVEIEIHKRKLFDLFSQDNENVYVNDIDDDVCRMYFDDEIKKLLCEGEINMIIVRDSKLVRNRLNDLHGNKLANILMSTWFELSTNGEEYVKENIPKSTFLRHKKLLKDSGVSWENTDIMKREFQLYPVDFKPLSTNYNCIHEVDQIILKKLEQVA